MREIRAGDTCTVTADWINYKDKAKRVVVLGFQVNPTGKGLTMRFVRVEWKGKQSTELREKYGDLFSVDELKLVKGV